ncbi:hypothetical protein [Bacillus mycoides]|uniref:Uncharacterized protein n=1 Tax=Bacillus mycoides TaxID=1405 RepID=A0A4U3AET3_BACMY|nr:hypothetical protein [Bacillus mycoides]TKI86507.1 hypothetical protein FC701_05495 [Bacillus mycoides]
MDLAKELEIILNCKKLLAEAFSVGVEEIEFIRTGHTYMYFGLTSPYKDTLYFRIDDLLDTFELKGSKWVYSMTI